MLVQFKDNLGSHDAEPLGLDFKKCTKGARLEVRDEIGERLVRRKFAVLVEIEGAAKKPAIAESKSSHELVKQAVEAVSMDTATAGLESYRKRQKQTNTKES